jgi:hypothetical protein
MTIYVVEQFIYNDEYQGIIGAYSSRELAQRAIDEQTAGRAVSYRIAETELDKLASWAADRW